MTAKNYDSHQRMIGRFRDIFQTQTDESSHFLLQMNEEIHDYFATIKLRNFWGFFLA